jgi:ABC-type tungstate transport system substrate-binding protein
MRQPAVAPGVIITGGTKGSHRAATALSKETDMGHVETVIILVIAIVAVVMSLMRRRA